MKAYRAFGAGAGCTANTPRAAAVMFFERFPTKRKCDVREGEASGDGFFTVVLGKGAGAKWNNVTKRTAHDLPNTN